MQLQYMEQEDENDDLCEIGENQHAEKPQKRKTFVGPWRNVDEFNKVYAWIYESASAESKVNYQLALSQIKVWSMRRSNLCPAAVLATSVMLDVQLKNSGGTSADDGQLQILYASAFSRFFNFMSSIMQSHNMRTMYETARQLRMPSFIVDLRHLCSHGQVLPPLEILRNTAAYSLDWLHDYYWQEQRSLMQDVQATHIRRKDRSKFDEDVTRNFAIFDAALEAHMKGAHNMKSARKHLHGKRHAMLQEYFKLQGCKQILDAIDGIVKELLHLLKAHVAIKDLSEIYIEALLKTKYFYEVAAIVQNDDEQLEKLLAAVQKLFRMMAVWGCLEDFFQSLFEIAENPMTKSTKRAGASFWAIQILGGFLAFRQCKQMYKANLDRNPNIKECDFANLNLEKTSKQLKNILESNGVNMKQTLLFGDSMRRPWVYVFERSFIEDHLRTVNEYTAPILKRILPLVDPPLNELNSKKLAALIDALFEFNSDNEIKINTNPNAIIYTANHLIKRAARKRKRALTKHLNSLEADKSDDNNDNSDEEQVPIKKYGLWSQVPDDESHNWPICPLGRLPWE